MLRSIAPFRAPLRRASWPLRRLTSSSSPPPPSLSDTSRLAPYLSQLRQRYPNSDPTSLTLSFLLLHELTALVPLVVLFGAFTAAGVGGGIVRWTLAETEPSHGGGWRGTVRSWLEEAEEKTERVGRRYGLFGWEKETAAERGARREREKAEREQGVVRRERELNVGGTVADMAAAYLVVKALLPLRILVSLRLSPWLANGAVGRVRAWRAARKGSSAVR
ncbi:hypothetical protein JCM10213_005857 [Rhodosporidiobolus nylandii]